MSNCGALLNNTVKVVALDSLGSKFRLFVVLFDLVNNWKSWSLLEVFCSLQNKQCKFQHSFLLFS